MEISRITELESTLSVAKSQLGSCVEAAAAVHADFGHDKTVDGSLTQLALTAIDALGIQLFIEDVLSRKEKP
ncbi:MAG: hypothetical protein GY832_11490 [Chloroflexi bacterium]|nr:hypothetical protein [Chloroflexota bacterium]